MAEKQFCISILGVNRYPTKTLTLIKPTVYIKIGKKERKTKGNCMASYDSVHHEVLNFTSKEVLKFPGVEDIFANPLEVKVMDLDALGCERLIASGKISGPTLEANWYPLTLDPYADESAPKPTDELATASPVFVLLSTSMEEKKTDETEGVGEQKGEMDTGYQEMKDVVRASRAASRISTTSGAQQPTDQDVMPLEDIDRDLEVEDIPNMIKLSVVKANDLVNEAYDTANAFVKVKYGHHEFGKSATVEGTLSPRFGWCYYLELKQKKDKKGKVKLEFSDLEIMVCEQRSGALSLKYDHVIGKFSLTSEEVSIMVEESRTKNMMIQNNFALEPEEGAGVCGSIYLNFDAIHIEKNEMERDFLKNGGYDSDNDSCSSGSECESSCESEEEEPENQEEKQRLQQEAREKAKQERAEMEAQLAKMEAAEVKEGRYEVKIHVIGVRGLVVSGDGVPCPTVRVTAWGKTQSTAIKQPTTETTFDEVLFYQLEDMNEDTLRLGRIRCEVYDANSLVSKGDMIGAWQTDFDFIYYQDDHEYYRKWVPLTGGHGASKTGMHGFLQLSVTILGPGDKSKHHNRDKEIEEEMRKKKEDPDGFDVDIPQQKLKFLVATFHKAENLPLLDDSVLAKGIDAFCRIQFGSANAQDTKVKTIRVKSKDEPINPVFKEEIWLPFYHPTFSNRIMISVFDKDPVGAERVATADIISLDLIERFPEAFEAFWVNLYGSPLNALPPDHIGRSEKMNKSPDVASTYKGRILMSMRIDDNESKTIKKRGKKVKSRPKKAFPLHYDKLKLPDPKIGKAKFAFRMKVLLGSELPVGMGKDEFCIQMSCGPLKIRTQTKKAVNGVCFFDHEIVECAEAILPADLGMVPDFMLHLIRNPGNNMPGFAEEAISFKRITAKEIFEKGFNTHPEWVRLEEDFVLNAVSQGMHPGCVLVQLGFGIKQKAESMVWPEVTNDELEERRGKFQARVHIYQARNLPAADDSGLIDPYIVVYFGGKKGKIDMKRESKNPLYYETVVIDDLTLPIDPHEMPMFIVQVWDWDLNPSGDDYVGSIHVSPSDDIVDFHSNTEPSHFENICEGAKWYQLGREKDGDTQGEVLLGFEIIQVDDASVPFPECPDLKPDSKEYLVQIISLGCRDLKGPWTGLQKPFVEFCVNDEVIHETSPSRNPSPDQPNFLPATKAEIKLLLPKDPVFAPAMEINVRDSLFGGIQKPLIGSAYVPLESRMKFNAKGERNESYGPQGDVPTGGNPFLDFEAELSKVHAARSRMQSTVDSEASRELMKQIAQETTEAPTEKAQKTELEKALALQPEFKELTDEEMKKMKPPYMINRDVDDDSWEEQVGHDVPFERFVLYTGCADLDDPNGKSNRRSVGIFKGIVRVLSSQEQKTAKDPPIIKEIQRQSAYQVRLYVLSGRGLTPTDAGTHKADPYLKVSLGDTEHGDRNNFQTATLSPDFYQRFDFVTKLPGVSQLHISVHDKNLLFDELIGTTTIDLEDRWFNAKWRQSGRFDPITKKLKKSVESRALWAPTSTNPQGYLTCWVDILTQKEASVDRPIVIAPQQNSEYEMRVIIWKAKQIPYGDPETSMSDMFITCDFGDEPQQSTDVHWRAVDGVGSFNYRMKFTIYLPIKGEGRSNMRFAVWDKDLLSSNDCLCEGTLDLAVPLKKAFLSHKNDEYQLFKTEEQIDELRELEAAEQSGILPFTNSLQNMAASPMHEEEPDENTSLLAGLRENHAASQSQMHSVRHKKNNKKKKEMQLKKKRNKKNTMWHKLKDQLGLGPDPDNTTWLPLQVNPTRKKLDDDPAILVSVSIVPKAKVESLPAGQGREEPNSNPQLPEPTGRIDFTKMVNPFYCIQAIIGSGNAAKLYCFCGLIIILALVVVCLPTLYDSIEFIEMLPEYVAYGVGGVILLLLCLGCFKAQKDLSNFCGCRHPCDCCSRDDTTNEDNV